MRALIEKELRENLRWLPVGIAIIGALIWYGTPQSSDLADFAYTESSLFAMMCFGGILFALVLGVLQSALDLRTASKSYLWHRAVSPRAIYYSKLIAGAMIYFAAASVPLAIVAVIFANRGLEHAPVRPLQVLPACLMAICSFALHPAAMFTIARHGSWFGTKLFPLLAVLGITFLITVGFEAHQALLATGPIFICVCVCVSVCLLLVVTIKASEHAWCNSSKHNGGNVEKKTDVWRKTVLGVGAFATTILGMVLFVMAVQLFAPDARSPTRAMYAIDLDGKLWYGQYKDARYEKGKYEYARFVSGSLVREGLVPDSHAELPKDKKLDGLSNLYRNTSKSCFVGQLSKLSGSNDEYFDRRGYVLSYDWSQRPSLKSITSLDGTHSIGEAVGKPFHGNPISMSDLRWNKSLLVNGEVHHIAYSRLWFDQQGVYKVSLVTGNVTKLLSMPIDALTIDRTNREGELHLLFCSNKKLHLYEIVENNDDIPTNFEGESQLPLELDFQLKLLGVFPELPRTLNECKLGITDDHKMVATFSAPQKFFATLDANVDSEWTIRQSKNLPETPYEKFDARCWKTLPGLFPPGILVSAFSSEVITGDRWVRDWNDLLYHWNDDVRTKAILSALVTLIAIALCIWACKRRGLTMSQTVSWCCWTILLGLASPLAVIAIYAPLRQQLCPGCDKLRRIDFRTCESCGAAWDPPANEGIEIFDERFERAGQLV